MPVSVTVIATLLRLGVAQKCTRHFCAGISAAPASCVRRSSQRRANRVWMGMRPTLEHLAEAGRGCWGACLPWIWPPVPCAAVARCGSLPPLPRSR